MKMLTGPVFFLGMRSWAGAAAAAATAVLGRRAAAGRGEAGPAAGGVRGWAWGEPADEFGVCSERGVPERDRGTMMRCPLRMLRGVVVVAAREDDDGVSVRGVAGGS